MSFVLYAVSCGELADEFRRGVVFLDNSNFDKLRDRYEGREL
jgi:hypothetical protein